MISFTEKVFYNDFIELEIGKYRMTLIEKALRLLGKFKSDEDIIVENDEYIKKSNEYIYEIKDQENTSFYFFSLSIGTSDKIKPSSRNYYLTMQRENSNFKYTYDVFLYNNNELNNELKLVEIDYSLSKNRKLNLIREKYITIITLSEQNKKYSITLKNHSETQYLMLLKKFENMIEKANSNAKLNLENIIQIISDPKQITSCHISKNDEEIASVEFTDGNVSKYTISESTKKVNVSIDEKIIRNVERLQDGELINYSNEITNANYEQIQSEFKKLLKRI